jgi:FAD/FMN-containing dehydrogenase
MTIENSDNGTMKRRTFLALCGTVGIAPFLLDACQSTTTSATSANPQVSPSQTVSSPSPTPVPKPTAADWSTLAHKLQGTLVRPGDTQYTTALQLFDPQFDIIKPMAVAYCASAADVQNCLAFVRQFQLPVAPRAGGHSYAGYSTTNGLVLDVTRMNTVAVDTGAATATIGAGARLIDVYSELSSQGVIIPAGSCPTVGVAGLTLGGGAGVIGRKFGLTCDNVQSAQVVIPDGRVLTCDANTNADLFWAIRGGGGGNFGVVTSFTFQTHPLAGLSLFTISWPWSSAAQVVDAWQNWAPTAPDEIWSNCLLDAPADKTADPIVQINGAYVGSLDVLNSLLAQLNAQISAAPLSNSVWSDSVLNSMLYEAGCYNQTVAACHLPTQNPAGQVARHTGGAKSDFFTSKLSQQGIAALIDAINQRHASSTFGEGGFGMDAYGGAINRVAADATAFVHRDALFSIQYNATWNADDAAETITANREWLNAIYKTMQPYASGQAYQNYIDPQLTNWQQAYYGANFARLQQVKAKYDPENILHFQQSITA